MNQDQREILGLFVVPIPRRYCGRDKKPSAECRAPRPRANVHIKKQVIYLINTNITYAEAL